MHDFYIYNTSTGKKELLKTIENGVVKMYTCGPTVYSTPHIGNFRTFTLPDFLKRALVYCGYEVISVMNLTDVGHLVGDGDDGEDKVEKIAKEKGISAAAVSDFYTKEFIDGLEFLNVTLPDKIVKASEHIAEQIDLIKELEAKGYTYVIENDGVYFNTKKYPDYGKTLKVDLAGLSEGARVKANPYKRNFTDFALWKFSSSQEGSRLQEWESPWGIGFPGWHLECSAMSTKYLGQPFDIHVGGEDLRFPHHTNEEAQSTCAHNKALANYWVYGKFLLLKDTKMAKSKGNVFNLPDAMHSNISGESVRYYYLTTHYNKQALFSKGILESSNEAYKNLIKELLVLSLESDSKKGFKLESWDSAFIEAISDDLNLPKALGLVHLLLKDTKASNSDKLATIYSWDVVLGLSLQKHVQAATKVPKIVQDLKHARDIARNSKDFAKADALKSEIIALGWQLEDTSNGTALFPK